MTAALSTLQMSAVDSLLSTNHGPYGFLLEDGQGFEGLTSYLTGTTGWQAPTIGAQESLRHCLTTFGTCFVLLNGSSGRPHIAAELDELLDSSICVDRLFFANYRGDHQAASDDLRRLFSMLAVTDLYYHNADHLVQISGAAEGDLAATQAVAKIFAELRELGLPDHLVNYREFGHVQDMVPAGAGPSSVAAAVRARLIDGHKVLFAHLRIDDTEFVRVIEGVLDTFLKGNL